MKSFKRLIMCLGLAVVMPVLAAGGATGEYSSLRPKSEMETAPAVLGQVKKGDQVNVSYYKAIAVDVVVPGAAPKSGSETAMVRAEPGAKPAGAVGRQTCKTVKILSVDPYKKATSSRDADGRWREVSMDRPDLEHYLKELKDGDTVDVTFTEAQAVSITKP